MHFSRLKSSNSGVDVTACSPLGNPHPSTVPVRVDAT